MPHIIGLISDTHGLVRPQVHQALAGVDLILHAGDVGGEDILLELGVIAPIQAVYGNTDAPGQPGLEKFIERIFDGLTVRVTHGNELGRPTPEQVLARYNEDILIYGHTHKPVIARFGDRLVINPGAAGPRRFDIKPTVARLTITDGVAEAELISLE